MPIEDYAARLTAEQFLREIMIDFLIEMHKANEHILRSMPTKVLKKFYEKFKEEIPICVNK